MNANELARDIIINYTQFIHKEVMARPAALNQWASTPEAKSLIAQLSGVGGMKWVKASERLPDTFFASDEYGDGSVTLSLKLSGTQCAGRYVVEAGLTKNCFVIAGFGFYGQPHFNEIEWLDESPIPSGEQDGGYDLDKLYDWVMDDNRPPAQTFFTASVARNIAKEIEYRLANLKK